MSQTPQERRAILAAALRKLPDGFAWEFRLPCTCALGLAKFIGLLDTDPDTEHTGILTGGAGWRYGENRTEPTNFTKSLGLTPDDAYAIFSDPQPDFHYGNNPPEAVAKALELAPFVEYA